MRSVVFCGGFLAAGLLGCSSANPYSSSAYPVSGTVLTPSGEPVRGAEIILTPKPKDGKVYGMEGSAELGKDGTFAIKAIDGRDGVPGGLYAVVVRPFGKPGSSDKQFATAQVPKRLWTEEQTDLSVEITEAKTGWVLKLTK